MRLFGQGWDNGQSRVMYPNQALEMFEKQDGKCVLCQTEMIRGNGLSNEGMVLDHCHDSGFIRGFTHQRCNKGLAMFLDHPETFIRAAEYITSFQNSLNLLDSHQEVLV